MHAKNWYKILIDFVTFIKLCCLSKLKPTLLRSMACQNNGCCSPSYRNLRWVKCLYVRWHSRSRSRVIGRSWLDLPIFRSPFFRQLRGATVQPTLWSAFSEMLHGICSVMQMSVFELIRTCLVIFHRFCVFLLWRLSWGTRSGASGKEKKIHKKTNPNKWNNLP